MRAVIWSAIMPKFSIRLRGLRDWSAPLLEAATRTRGYPTWLMVGIKAVVTIALLTAAAAWTMEPRRRPISPSSQATRQRRRRQKRAASADPWRRHGDVKPARGGVRASRRLPSAALLLGLRCLGGPLLRRRLLGARARGLHGFRPTGLCTGFFRCFLRACRLRSRRHRFVPSLSPLGCDGLLWTRRD